MTVKRQRIPPALRAFTAGVLAVALLAGCDRSDEADRPAKAEATRAAATGGLQIPIDYRKLDNGLKVVLSEDHSVPIATVAVYYHIGFRNEPRERTGFAHLFEHMMFQGSNNLGKMEFVTLIQGNGGVLNGSTRFDYTNYFETVPANKLETVLWAEADRMKGLAISQENLDNQKSVVKNEVKVNVLNQPYGGFPWLDMPQYANENWYNAHNFYGELEDLDAATLDEVRAFFRTYYAPNNAALLVIGDIDPAETWELVERYFGAIAPAELPPPPDFAEPRQAQEKRFTREDPLAPRPGLAFAYHMPERGTPEYYAMGIIDQVLLQGEDSRLYQTLVKEHAFTGSVGGGINMIGNMFNYEGPMLWTAYLIHDPEHAPEHIMSVVDEVVERLREEPIAQDDLDRARIKLRSALYDVTGSPTRFGLVDLLAAFSLFDDDPGHINRIEQAFAQVTPALVRDTAREYLRPGNRTVLGLVPAIEAAGVQE